MRWACMLLSVMLIGCGGAGPSTDLLRDAQRLDATLGELEAEALTLTQGLVETLSTSDDPDAVVGAIEGYVDANLQRMRDVAAAVAEKFAALTGDEHASYHQVFGDSMSDATYAWLDGCAQFIEDHPDHEQRLRDVVRPMGPLRLPPSED